MPPARHPVALALLLLATPALAQEPARQPRPDGLSWNGPIPTLQLADGNFTIRPTLRFDADAGSFFGQDNPGGYRSGVNLRRGRLGLGGTFLQDFGYAFTWELGGSAPNDYGNFYEGQIFYTGIRNTTLRIGAFTPQHLPEYAGASFDLPFLERSTITNVAASLAAGDTREAVGFETNGAIGDAGARFNISGYATGGVASTPHDDRQRGLVGRAVLLAADRPGFQLQIGGDVAAQFHPGTNPGPESIRLRDYPELRVDTRRFLDSGSIRADSAWAAGPELSARVGPVYVEAVWQHVHINATTGADREYDGWYAQALVPLLGKPRERSRDTATWRRPSGDGPLGAIELGARYSSTDLREAGQGSRQDILTVGVNWYPTSRLRFAAQYENGHTDLPGRPNRDFQAVGLRAAFTL
ncbi:OprO/OprP family phosphate-selective porin [Roseomonas sp. WA12]